uniref:CRAL-TRIO domain-containing protein n=1 Tax=Bursaphelenchus xylophilus TaxID=6326 RepID=A0A1I7S289_BURXY
MLSHQRQWNPEIVGASEEMDKLSLDSAVSSEGLASNSAGEISEDDIQISADLTVSEIEKIKNLKTEIGKELLEKTPLMNDEFSLHRWICGWDNKVAEILPRYAQMSEIVEALGFNEFVVNDEDEVNTTVVKYNHLAQFFAGGVMGFDNDGDLITCSFLGNVRPRTLVKCGSTHQVFKMAILDAVLIMKLLKKREEKTGKQAGCKIIMDLSGFGMEHLFAPTVKIYLNLIKLLQDMFPELTRKIYVINSPTIFTTAFGLIKPILSEKTRSKIEILGSNYQKFLLEELGEHNVYPLYGGSKKPTKGDSETGTLRMGGVPHKENIYNPIYCPHSVDDDKLTKINVPARSKKSLDFECKAGQTLKWFFKSSGDIDLSVYLDNKILYMPKLRLNTEFVPEFDEVLCKADGTYSIIFDNSFSTFFSKDVRHHIQIVD